MKVYLDNAASTPLDPEVLAHMEPYFCELTGNPSSTHAHGRVLKTALENARRTIARCIGARPGEIIFTSGGTEADNTAIFGAVEAYGLRHIVTTSIEHHAVGHTVEALEKAGKVTVTWLDVDQKGYIDLHQLDQTLLENPRSLVTLMHANNEIGTLYDLQSIGEICQTHDALFHSDTVQTMGQYTFEMEKLPIDFAAASAHKFYGPKGVGFLYIRKGRKLPSYLIGGGQERSMRAGTENLPGIIGMAFALEKCYGMLEAKTARLKDLKGYMQRRLQEEIPGAVFIGEADLEKSLPSVLNVSFDCGAEDAMLPFHLDIAGISVSAGSACNSGANTGSHVLRGLGLPPERTQNNIRFSFGMPNSREEINYTLETLKQILPVTVKS